MQQQLGDEADSFFLALQEPPPSSIRLHHKKGKSDFSTQQRVIWCENGYYLKQRPSFHLDPHWHGGAYYVQEASSMIFDAVFQQLHLDSSPRIWLDLCAAPGGKTGIMAKHLGAADVLIANEVIHQRNRILYENLMKGGYLNVFISGERAANFPHDFADVILIDAPCAGEGMMRKEPEAIEQWSASLVQSCSRLQQEIVRDAVQILKPGGWLLYSTCSYSPDENMLNAGFFLERFPLEIQPLRFPDDWKISELQKDRAIGYQLFPHRVKGEGLFFSVFRKGEKEGKYHSPVKREKQFFEPVQNRWAPVFDQPDRYWLNHSPGGMAVITAEAKWNATQVMNRFPKAELIGKIGEVKGKDFIPSHFLAMAGIMHQDTPSISLDYASALDFLERKTVQMNAMSGLGWHAVNYSSTVLGWMKNTQQGWKNYYPMNWRLRNRN